MSYKPYNNCLKASAVAFFLLLLQPVVAQTNFNALTNWLNEKQSLLGKDFVVMASSNDTVVYAKSWGTMNAKTVTPIHQASSWLTAALVLQFVDEGKLSLDDKITKYLPVFEKYGKNYITIRHCLAHLTGIQDKGGKIARLLKRETYNTLDENVAAIAAKEIETNPGTAFHYSSFGYIIAGRILEVISKKRFDLLIKQKLLTPLGMRQTTFTTTDGSAPDPFDGARSTAADFMAFLKMMLNNGTFNDKQVLSATALAELRSVPTSNVTGNNAPDPVAGLPYTMGAWAFEKDGTKAIVLTSPGFSGTWPIVDFCRGYALLYIAKEEVQDAPNALYVDLKKLVNIQFPSACH